ncbi:MAG TPA: hypothetical protein VGJ84_13300, partial [Polyangiaceae bacterium]
LSRLYWWTAEYGLVGSVNNYKLYGAGLLSSLSESHFCHEPRVRKIALTKECVDVSYDITRPQPQLFVAKDFEQLNQVLDQVEPELAYWAGGMYAAGVATRSQEVATVELDGGTQVIGIVDQAAGTSDEPRWLVFRGPCGIGSKDGLLEGFRPEQRSEGLIVPLGRLADGTSLAGLSEPELRKRLVGADGRVSLRYRSGLELTADYRRAVLDAQRKVILVSLGSGVLTHNQGELAPASFERFDLVVAEQPLRARAGAADPMFFSPTEFSTEQVPRPREFAGSKQRLLRLYEQTDELVHKALGSQALGVFENVYQELARAFPDEWLLRWNLLEGLLKLDLGGGLRETLHRELMELEIRFDHREPIASGLRYLGLLAGG